MNSNVKVVFIVGIISLLSQVLTVIIYPLLSKIINEEDLARIAVFDANMMLVIGWLGFGISVVATRDIATSSDWRPILKAAQSARFTLSLLFFIVGLLCLISLENSNILYFVLVLAPLLSLNYDYALYALGRPFKAACISFVRVACPLIIVLCIALTYTLTLDFYIFVTISFFVISSVWVSKVLNTDLHHGVSRDFYKLYINSAMVGFSGFVIGLQRYGFINFFHGSLSNEEIIVLMQFIKINLFLVACKRMLIQIFYAKLLDPKIRLFIAKLCFSTYTCVLLACYLFDNEFAYYLFGSENYRHYSMMIGVLCFCVLFFPTSETLLLYNKKDTHFLVSTLIIGFAFYALILLLELKLFDIILLLVAAEFFLSLLYFISVKITSRKTCG